MMPSATVSTLSDVVIEHYEYQYTGAGLPIIALTVRNTGSAELHGDLAVRVSKALESAQNEFVYRKVGGAKALRDVAFQPGGKEQRIYLREVPVLKPAIMKPRSAC